MDALNRHCDRNEGERELNILNAGGTSSEIRLQSGHLWQGKELDEPCTVFCKKGHVWVTRSNDSRDYHMKAGDAWILTFPHQVVIQALEESLLGIFRHITL